VVDAGDREDAEDGSGTDDQQQLIVADLEAAGYLTAPGPAAAPGTR
jgi:hypothetical protein